MASLFLSYSREDASRVGPLAAALEGDGHKVWWDRHITGGDEFADAIEQALESAEVVIACYDDPAHWLPAAGLQIPKDIGLIRPHVNDKALGIGGFLFEDSELGAAAIDLVVEQLNHNERGLPDTVKRVLLPGRWFDGRSLKPAVADAS